LSKYFETRWIASSLPSIINIKYIYIAQVRKEKTVQMS